MTKYILTTCLIFILGSCVSNHNKYEASNKTDSSTLHSITEDSIVSHEFSDTTYIGLYIQLSDSKVNKPKNSILIIGKYFNGKYYSFEDNVSDEENNHLKIDSRRIFGKNKEYYIFEHSQLIDKATVSGIRFENIKCLRLPVGVISTQSNYMSQKKSRQSYKGYSDGKEVDINFDYHIALSNNVYQKNRFIQSNLPTTIENSIFLKLKNHFLDSLNQTKFNRKTVEIKSLSNESDTLIFANYHNDNEENCISSAQLFRYKSRMLSKVLELNQNNGIDSWGAGYKLFDVLDIDGDGVSEIIFEVGYYESTGFEIYKLVNGRYTKVMHVVPWGC